MSEPTARERAERIETAIYGDVAGFGRRDLEMIEAEILAAERAAVENFIAFAVVGDLEREEMLAAWLRDRGGE